MSMLEFPTFEEMVAVMNSPSSPPSPMDFAGVLDTEEYEMELTTDEMVREIFSMMKSMTSKDDLEHEGVQIGNGGKATAPNANDTYNSNTSTYDGGVAGMTYNGGM